MAKEVWRDVVGHEGKYMVSSHGRVENLKRKRVLALFKDKDGYLIAKLSLEDGTSRTLKTHRLVAIAFIPNPLDKKEINHKDGNKKNNRLTNLMWCTRKENMEHAGKNNLMPRVRPRNHLGQFKSTKI